MLILKYDLSMDVSAAFSATSTQNTCNETIQTSATTLLAGIFFFFFVWKLFHQLKKKKWVNKNCVEVEKNVSSIFIISYKLTLHFNYVQQ